MCLTILVFDVWVFSQVLFYSSKVIFSSYLIVIAFFLWNTFLQHFFLLPKWQPSFVALISLCLIFDNFIVGFFCLFRLSFMTFVICVQDFFVFFFPSTSAISFSSIVVW